MLSTRRTRLEAPACEDDSPCGGDKGMGTDEILMAGTSGEGEGQTPTYLGTTAEVVSVNATHGAIGKRVNRRPVSGIGGILYKDL